MILNPDEMGRLVLETVLKAVRAGTGKPIKRALLEEQIRAAFDNGDKWSVSRNKREASYKIVQQGVSLFGEADGYFPFNWKTRSVGKWVNNPSIFKAPSIVQMACNRGSISNTGSISGRGAAQANTAGC
jgi:hypothetical protein